MRPRVGLICLAVALPFAVAPGFFAAQRTPVASATPQQRPDGLYARIDTSRGVIVARLEPEKTPLTVTSFAGLAEGTIANEAFAPGEPYYDGSIFHRVVPGHVVQAGMPATDRSDARGPGYTFPNEIHAQLSHDHAGALGMANGGPGTNSAQFYITLGDRSYLDGDYIVFGDVVAGLEVVHAIEQGDVVESIRIDRVGERAEAFRADTASFEERVAAAKTRVDNDARDRRRLEREWVTLQLGHLQGLVSDGVLRFPQKLGGGGLVVDGDRLSIRYAGIALRYRGHMLELNGPLFEEVRFASAADGTPQNVDLAGAVFEYEVGASTVTPGFDTAISQMRRGGQEIIVVPYPLAYGGRGFYGPDRPGRLVISPNTRVLYAIEVRISDSGH